MMTREDVEASTYLGKPIRNLTREELLDVIAVLFREKQESDRMHEGTLRILSLVAKRRR